MTQKVRTWIAVICLTVVGSGCATASRGTSQSIQVGSNPEGAECVFTREGETLGKVTTPGPVTVKRDKRPINVVCTKDGHEEARAVLNSLTDTSAPLLAGPSVIAGLAAVSNLVDMASGADTRYQTALMVKLEPASPADQAALAIARTTPASPPAAAASVQAPAATALAPVAASGSFDGEYTGSAQLNSGSSRQIEVRVVGRDGVGTAHVAGCAEAGNVKMVIDQAGAITGDADILARATCAPSHHKLEGRVDGDRLLITLAPNARFPGVGEFSLIRRANPR